MLSTRFRSIVVAALFTTFVVGLSCVISVSHTTLFADQPASYFLEDVRGQFRQHLQETRSLRKAAQSRTLPRCGKPEWHEVQSDYIANLTLSTDRMTGRSWRKVFASGIIQASTEAMLDTLVHGTTDRNLNRTEDDTAHCDLSRCNSNIYPIIHFVATHRNRMPNLLRLIASMRLGMLSPLNTTASLLLDSKSDENRHILFEYLNKLEKGCISPEWLDCLCITVADYHDGSSEDQVLPQELHRAWPGRVRIERWDRPPHKWSKPIMLNLGTNALATPPERTLTFHIDVDLIATDLSFIIRPLQNASPSEAFFPIVWSTYQHVSDLTALYKLKLAGMRSADDWHINSAGFWRDSGTGMVWYYRSARPTGLFKRDWMDSAGWGGEDNEFMAQFKDHFVRYRDPSLIHIYHVRHAWLSSVDGITPGTESK